MKICFIVRGPIEWASSRMRCFWVAECLNEMGYEASCISQKAAVDHWELLSECDVVVWQKMASIETIQRVPDSRHYWDVCDPSWWWQPDMCHDILSVMGGVVCSNDALAADFRQWSGRDTHVIPDRLKLSHFHTQRRHSDVSPVRLIWYGVAINRVALYGTVVNMERLVANGVSVELTIMDNRPDIRFDNTDMFPTYYVPWKLEHEVKVIAGHDIALLPPFPGPWGDVKSNNKRLTAAACGLPVASGLDYKALFALTGDGDVRRYYGERGLEEVHESANIERSAVDWIRILE